MELKIKSISKLDRVLNVTIKYSENKGGYPW